MTEEETQLTFQTDVTLLVAAWPFVKYDERNLTKRMQQCEPLFTHVESLKSLFEEPIRKGTFMPTSPCAALFNEVSWYMIEKAIGLQIGIYASLSQIILEHCLSEESTEVQNLKKLLADSHQYQAISGIETNSGEPLKQIQAWMTLILEKMERDNEPKDAVDLAEAYNEAGLAYMRLNKETEALASWHQSLVALENVAGNTKINQTWPSIHLGIMYSIRGEGDKGEKILIPVLKARQEECGKDDTTSMVTGKLLHAVGDVRRSQDRLDEAMELYERALRIFKLTIGNHHYITADTCYRLAEQFIRVGKNDEANALLEQSLKVYRDIRWFLPQAARSSFMKGRLLESLGNGIEGKAQVERAMKIRSQIDQDDHRTADQLRDQDFDRLVYYYSR